jgi:hypothetical protein
LLLTTVLFFFFSFFFFCSWPFFWTWPHAYLPCSLSYLHKYCTNFDTLFIIPYWHSYPNN